MSVPVLQTSRLTLRPITRADVPAIQKHFAHWDIIKHLSMDVPWPYPNDGAHTFFENHITPTVQSGAGFFWAITLKGHGDGLIGLIDYRAKENATGNRGFWLAQEFQGGGIMSEAITAVQDFLFFDCGIESLRAMNAINNPASRRVKEKTGATLIDVVECLHHSGESKSELWEITKENWTKFRQDKKS